MNPARPQLDISFFPKHNQGVLKHFLDSKGQGVTCNGFWGVALHFFGLHCIALLCIALLYLQASHVTASGALQFFNGLIAHVSCTDITTTNEFVWSPRPPGHSPYGCMRVLQHCTELCKTVCRFCNTALRLHRAGFCNTSQSLGWATQGDVSTRRVF